MGLHPRLTRSGLELVMRFEGLRRTAARLPAGGWTIGYGHTVSAREGAEVSQADAETLLLYDLNKVAAAVDELVFTPLNANQFDALVAFAFNIGLEAFRASDVLRRVNEGNVLLAASAIEAWRQAEFGGAPIVVDALVRRRAAEKALFLTPPEGFRPVPSPVVRAQFDRTLRLSPAARDALASAADLRTPLDGEVAAAQWVEPDGPTGEDTSMATTLAAANVAARVDAILAHEAAPETPPPPFSPNPPAEQPQAVIEAEPVHEAQREPAPAEEIPVAPTDLSEPPPPRVFEPRLVAAADDAFDDAYVEEEREPSFPRRTAKVDAGPLIQLPADLWVLGLGVLGAGLFVLALVTMMAGSASLVLLTVGLVGVVCMVPAAMKLLTRLFSHRGEPHDDFDA